MKRSKTSKPKKQRRIADEILFQVGRSVLAVFLIVAIVAIFMVRWIIVSSKESELTLQSKAASYQLTGFFEQYEKASKQLAASPEIKYVLEQTVPGGSILDTDKMDTVKQNLVNIAETDTNNIMATWIADLDTSTLTQSDGYTSGSDWDITGRVWYKPCVEEKRTTLTEPYLDPATQKIILSAVTPVFGESGAVLGVAGIDVSMEEINKGNEIANGVMVSLEESVSAVGRVNDMIKKTAENAVLQAENMEQIRTGIDDIAQGVNDNSAVSEETYATSEQLATQTVTLNEMVQRFEF